jgi:hypothetical protein
MKILQLGHDPAQIPPEAALLVALDGWTDAGAGGSTAAAALHEQFGAERLGRFDPAATAGRSWRSTAGGSAR